MDDTGLRNLFPNYIPDTEEWKRWQVIRDALLLEELKADKRNWETLRMTEREAAYNERRLEAEVTYWKNKDYKLGGGD